MGGPPAKDAALERRWNFTNASEGQRLGAIALGVANCVGVLYLGSLLAQPGVSQMLAQSSLGFMNNLFPFLQVSSVLVECNYAPSSGLF